MRSLIFAVQFLTRLPLPMRANQAPDALAAAAKWFPLVGFIIGGFLAACLALGAKIDPWLGALLPSQAGFGSPAASIWMDFPILRMP